MQVLVTASKQSQNGTSWRWLEAVKVIDDLIQGLELQINTVW
jgi:hypothetical protein